LHCVATGTSLCFGWDAPVYCYVTYLVPGSQVGSQVGTPNYYSTP
jgi:hypothetical protein